MALTKQIAGLLSSIIGGESVDAARLAPQMQPQQAPQMPAAQTFAAPGHGVANEFFPGQGPLPDASYMPQPGAAPQVPPQALAPVSDLSQQAQPIAAPAASGEGSGWDRQAWADMLNASALGFNTMRLTPDQQLAADLRGRIDTSRKTRLSREQANKTAEWFRSQPGMEHYADLIEQNPSIAGDILKEAIKAKAGGGLTDAVKTKQQIAAMLGYEPGSPEYEAHMKGEPLGKMESDLRKEFIGQQNVKDFSKQSQAFGRIIASAQEPSAAGDLALIFNYMKVLDPGSTVREGEFANAQNAGGLDTKVRSLYNNILRGTRLTEEQRADFVDRGTRLYRDAEQQYSSLETFYTEKAGSTGFLPNFRYQGDMPGLTTVAQREALFSGAPQGIAPELWSEMSASEQRKLRNMTPEQRQQFMSLGGQ